MLDTGQISIYVFFASAHNNSIPRSKEFSQRMESELQLCFQNPLTLFPPQ